MSKVDPKMVFWASPGINADLLAVKQGRLCRRHATPPAKTSADVAEDVGNSNRANPIKSSEQMFDGLELWAIPTTEDTLGKLTCRS